MSASGPAAQWTTPRVTETARAALLIAEHDETWNSRFERERDQLRHALGLDEEQIQHIGSTAVAGLAARPVLDIVAGLRTHAVDVRLLSRLAALGYKWAATGVPRDTLVLVKHRATVKPPVQLFLTRDSSRFWQDGLLIRDFLRGNWEAVRQYNRLKRRLAAKYLKNARGYQRAKAAFLDAITKRVRKQHNCE